MSLVDFEIERVRRTVSGLPDALLVELTLRALDGSVVESENAPQIARVLFLEVMRRFVPGPVASEAIEAAFSETTDD